jgi:hypothetical protein
MKDIKVFKRKQPWRDALIATTGYIALLFLSSLLWTSGYEEWAFALAFFATWILLAISWSNIDFTEKSGTLLAEVMDHNFEHMHSRIAELEENLSRRGGKG